MGTGTLEWPIKGSSDLLESLSNFHIKKMIGSTAGVITTSHHIKSPNICALLHLLDIIQMIQLSQNAIDNNRHKIRN